MFNYNRPGLTRNKEMPRNDNRKEKNNVNFLTICKRKTIFEKISKAKRHRPFFDLIFKKKTLISPKKHRYYFYTRVFYVKRSLDINLHSISKKF